MIKTKLTMKTDKEYPATHSMETSWFAIDADGEVAIIDFEDNGPVPDNVSETCIEDLVLETFDEKYDFHIDYTDEQWDDIMSKAKPFNEYPYENFSFLSDMIVEVDMYKFDLILAAFNNNPKRNTLRCLNKSKNIYLIDFWFKWDDNETKQKELDEVSAELNYKLFTERAIIRYIEIDEHWVEDEVPFEGSNVDKHVGIFEAMPFYLYQQPYTGEYPIEKTFVPTKPINAKQLSKAFIDNALKLPFRFADTDKFQIAMYLKCSAMTEPAEVDGELANVVATPENKGYFVFSESDKKPIEIDEAFENHIVKFDSYRKEYKINGKRGFFETQVIDDSRVYYSRIGCLGGYFEDEIQTIEIVNND